MTALAKKTISICVSPAELVDIKKAADMAGRTVSAWAYANTMAAATTKSTAMEVVADHKEVSFGQTATSRCARMSVVMTGADHHALTLKSKLVGLSVHGFIQTVVVTRAKSELGGLAPVVVRRLADVDASKAVEFKMPHGWVSSRTPDLTDAIAGFFNTIPAAVYAGQGPALRGKIDATMERYPFLDDEPSLRVSLPRAEVELTAKWLGIQPGALMRALAIRAIGKPAPADTTPIEPEGKNYLTSQQHVVDQFGNKATLKRWGTHEAAKAALDTVVDCKNCTDCERCVGCVSCTNCTDCKDCTGCHKCRACTNCHGCADCRACGTCTACFECETCFDCEHCRECEGCTDGVRLQGQRQLGALELESIDPE